MLNYHIDLANNFNQDKIILTFTSSKKFQDKHLDKMFTKKDITLLQELAKLQNFEAKEKTFIQANLEKNIITYILANSNNLEYYAINLINVFSNIAKTYPNQNISIISDDISKAQLQQIVLAWHKAFYSVHDRFSLKTHEIKTPPHLTIITKEHLTLETQLQQSLAYIEALLVTKDAANLPPNIATPSFLASIAKDIAKQNKQIKVNILEKKQIEALGLNAFLAVTKGSLEEPKLITLEYNGLQNGEEKPKTKVKSKKLTLDNDIELEKNKLKPIILVGKGITFDSGGISLKPSDGMDEMKYDMCGAASVLGIFKALAILQPKIHVIGIIPSCENMPSGSATRPGDIIKSKNGLSIEILNTDAEGRLILCDALTYAQTISKPQLIIDIATLTGACVIALGHHHSGLFSNNQVLANELLQAGKNTLDTAWQMPIEPNYREQLKSNFADLANIGGRPAGSITAACFLQHFIENNIPWAHLDIAGTAWKSGKEKGATGRPVGLLLDFLLSKQIA